MTRSAQRIVGIIVLAILGIVMLPVTATFVDGDGAENWILVVYLVAMAVLGAAVGIALPGLAREGADTGRRALAGAGWGVLGAVIGLVVFFLLLSGFDGA